MAVIADFKEIQRQVQEAAKGAVSGFVPSFAKGVVTALRKGWCRAEYYDALTGERFRFYETPTVVAVGLVREGLSRLVTAPTIEIPTVQLPALPKIEVSAITLPEVPTIDVPSITLPTAPTITIPKPEIRASMQTFPYFSAAPGIGHDVAQALCDQLNRQTEMLLKLQGSEQPASPYYGGVILAISYVNSGLRAAYDTVEAVIKEIKEFRDNSQVALNGYSEKIKASVDAGLADLKGNTEVAVSQLRSNVEASVQAALNDYKAKIQAAFDVYRSNIQVGVNAGLSQFIPALYDMMGLPPPEVPEADRQALREMGDVNGDGVIDQKDIDLIKSAYAAQKGDARYVEAYDLNHDGSIDVRDVSIASKNYGKSIVPTTQLLSPAQIRNVTADGFEFYGLSAGFKLSYVAVGRR